MNERSPVRTLYLRQSRRREPLNRHLLYEQAKNIWLANHPESTPAEYSAAMTRIAKELNI